MTLNMTGLMKSGTTLRRVLNKLNEVDFNRTDDHHTHRSSAMRLEAASTFPPSLPLCNEMQLKIPMPVDSAYVVANI